MSPQTIMAVGGHIGDMDLTAGPILAQNVLNGGRSVLVALTPGERGHPRMTIADYREQKIAEARSFAEGIGAEVIIFDDMTDGFLPADDAVAERLADLIRDIKPSTLLAHWRHSMHTDHENASKVAERARFLAGLPGWKDETERHGVGRLMFTENWEDSYEYKADHFVEISAEAHQRWTDAISGQAFARGETYGFRYIDFYSAQMITRGCLAGVPYAVALSSGPTFAMDRLA